jgi:ppGpp synthetase/RelA/SpoT-type nucleotidyltranferase
MVPLELESWLGGIQSPLGQIRLKVRDAVLAFCGNGGYAYSDRLKDAQSIAEKLETGRVDRLWEIDDLFGCSIIIPNLSHEARVLKRLGEMFVAVTVKTRDATYKDPEVFRFEATRFIGNLKTEATVDERLGSVLFEIQVRTAFEHAWSVATHSEAYKSQRIDWKLERLAAQMKALVEQLDSLAVAYEQSAESLVQHRFARTDCEVKVFDRYRRFMTDGLFPDESQPSKWGLFAKNIVTLADAADWGTRLYLEERVDRLINVVEHELRRLGKSKYPYSLSLFQFTLGVLVETQAIAPNFRKDRYFPPISAALEELFPRTRHVHPRCAMVPPP